MTITKSKMFAAAVIGIALGFAAPAMADRDRHHNNGRGYHQSQHYDGGYRHHGGHKRVSHHYHRPARHHGRHHEGHGSDAIAVVGGALLVGGILHHLAH